MALTRKEMVEELTRRGAHVPKEWSAKKVASLYQEFMEAEAAAEVEPEPQVLPPPPPYRPASPRG